MSILNDGRHLQRQHRDGKRADTVKPAVTNHGSTSSLFPSLSISPSNAMMPRPRERRQRAQPPAVVLHRDQVVLLRVYDLLFVPDRRLRAIPLMLALSAPIPLRGGSRNEGGGVVLIITRTITVFEHEPLLLLLAFDRHDLLLIQLGHRVLPQLLVMLQSLRSVHHLHLVIVPSVDRVGVGHRFIAPNTPIAPIAPVAPRRRSNMKLIRFAIGPTQCASASSFAAARALLVRMVSAHTLSASDGARFPTPSAPPTASTASATAAAHTVLRGGAPQRFGGSICTLRLTATGFNAVIATARSVSERVIPGAHHPVSFTCFMVLFGPRAAECMIRLCSANVRRLLVLFALRLSFHQHLAFAIARFVHSADPQQHAAARNEQDGHHQHHDGKLPNHVHQVVLQRARTITARIGHDRRCLRCDIA